MVRIQEVNNRQPSDDVEYEDVSDEYTDDDEGGEYDAAPVGGLPGMLAALLPDWLAKRAGRWSTAVYARVGVLFARAGSLAWIFTTSMLLIGLPVLFAYDREKSLQEQQLGSLSGSSSSAN